MNFSQLNLDSRLQRGINRLGFTVPTPIQEKAIPAALQGTDLIATAQTGTGKTAAFVLPILNRLLKGSSRQVRALIVTPTRELADQIHENIRDLANGTHLHSVTIFGGVSQTPQLRALQAGAEIIVACPGRLLDLVDQRRIDLRSVEVLVLDEADRMFDMGFLPAIKKIIRLVPENRQTMLFSATFPAEVEQLAQQALKNPTRITIGLSAPAETVAHALLPVPQHLKTALVMELLKTTDTQSVLIFTRTRHRAEKLARQIQQTGEKVTSLHSDRSQEQRKRAIQGFKAGNFRIMVATDIAARGLDVEGISHVINFDMPSTADDYIHRIGRTGRAHHTGDALTLVTPDDFHMVRTLEKIMPTEMETVMLEGFDYKVAAPIPVRSGGTGRPSFSRAFHR
jgi:ATP-dependent RNA helicase RhlE